MAAGGGGGAAAAGAAKSGLLKGVAVAALGGVTAVTMMTASVIGGVGSASAEGCDPDGNGSQPYVSQKPSEKAVSDIPQEYYDLYTSAASEYGIDKFVLAAVGKAETGHGSNMGPSSAGAEGPMQFMPDTWASVGLDANGDGTANVMDPEDAIPTAAKYLRDNGAPDDYYGALYAYNNSDAYVQDVLAIAEEYRAAEPADGTIALLLDSSLATLRYLNPFAQEIPLAYADMNGAEAVDENRNMHYESNTTFGSAWSHAVGVWNPGGAVKIAESPGGGETDLYVGDGDLPGSTMGHTSVSNGIGEITFDIDGMANGTDNGQRAVAAHEAGHAMSFEHADGSVMQTPVMMESSDNYDTPTDYDWSVYEDKWGGGQPQEPSGGEPPSDEPPSDAPSDEPPSDTPSRETPSDDPPSDTPSRETPSDEPPSGGSDPGPTVGSKDLFQDLFGKKLDGNSSFGGEREGGEREGGEREGGGSYKNQTITQTQTGDGGGGNERPDSGNGFPFDKVDLERSPDEERDGKDTGDREQRGGNEERKADKKSAGDDQYGGGAGPDDEQDGGGGGDAKAVFPLSKEYHDDFSNDWGAARSQGSHEGTDIFAPDGTPISSITSGTVVKSGWDELGGNTVLIKADKDVGPVRAGDQLYYAHMQEASSLQPGDAVQAGDTVGNVGSTGEGPPGTLLPEGRGQHLHLGWYDETGNRAETASGAMNTYALLTWLVDNGGEASGGPSSPGPCPDEAGNGGGDNPQDADSPKDGSQPGTGSSNDVVMEAEKYMGVTYVLGGPEACVPGEQMDCTCLTTTVFKNFGYTGANELPDWPQSLHDYGEAVAEADIQAGDIIVYNDPGDGTGGHTGIAINSTEMIHACLPCGETVIGPIFEVPNYGGARRLV